MRQIRAIVASIKFDSNFANVLPLLNCQSANPSSGRFTFNRELNLLYWLDWTNNTSCTLA